MTINMDKAETGQKVRFRNGGKSVITRIEPSIRNNRATYLCLDKCIHGIDVTKTGRLLSRSNEYKPVKNCPFDIVEVKP